MTSPIIAPVEKSKKILFVASSLPTEKLLRTICLLKIDQALNASSHNWTDLTGISVEAFKLHFAIKDYNFWPSLRTTYVT